MSQKALELQRRLNVSSTSNCLMSCIRKGGCSHVSVTFIFAVVYTNNEIPEFDGPLVHKNSRLFVHLRNLIIYLGVFLPPYRVFSCAISP